MNEVTKYGLTMRWELSRGRIYNAANPFTLYGYIDGGCRLQCGVSAETASSRERVERHIADRLSQIARESENGKIKA